MNIKEINSKVYVWECQRRNLTSSPEKTLIYELYNFIKDLEAENERLRELADSAINEWEEQVFHTDIGDPKDQKKYRDALSKDK